MQAFNFIRKTVDSFFAWKKVIWCSIFNRLKKRLESVNMNKTGCDESLPNCLRATSIWTSCLKSISYKSFCWLIPFLSSFWRVFTIQTCASLNHRKTMKAERSPLFPRKLAAKIEHLIVSPFMRIRALVFQTLHRNHRGKTMGSCHS